MILKYSVCTKLTTFWCQLTYKIKVYTNWLNDENGSHLIWYAVAVIVMLKFQDPLILSDMWSASVNICMFWPILMSMPYENGFACTNLETWKWKFNIEYWNTKHRNIFCWTRKKDMYIFSPGETCILTKYESLTHKIWSKTVQ